MRSTGGNSDGVSNKSAKKEKVRRLSEMDEFSHSITTNSTSKRVKLPKKFYYHCGIINLAPVPRKLRSATKKREPKPLKICTKKLKPVAVVKEREDPKTSPRECIVEEITKDEEEVAEALFALAQTFPTNETSEAEPSLFVLEESAHTKTPKKDENSNDLNNGKNSRKRCLIHVHICNFIKVLQSQKYKESGIDEGSNVISNTKRQKITNGCDDRTLIGAENMHGRLFQDQRQPFDTMPLEAGGGCVADGSNVASTQLRDNACVRLEKTQNHHSSSFDERCHLSDTMSQQVPSYFDTVHYDCSQWSTQILTKQQSWSNQLQITGHHQNWRNRSYNTTPLSGSSVEMFGSKYVLGSNTKQQQQQQHGIPISLLATNKGKMQFSYNKNGGLFLVDSTPTLKLTL